MANRCGGKLDRQLFVPEKRALREEARMIRNLRHHRPEAQGATQALA